MNALESNQVASPQSQRENLRNAWSAAWQQLAQFARTIRFHRRTQTLYIQESLSVGERRSLVVVRWENRRYLLGVTPQAFHVLDTDRPSDVLSRTSEEQRI